MKKNLFETKDLVRIALLGAMGFALMYLNFPLPFLPPFLKYDFGDVPALFAGFAMGPIAGVFTQFIKVLIYFLSGRSSTGVLGVAANFIAGGSLTLVAGILYQIFRGKKKIYGSLIGGVIAMVIVTTVTNIYIFLPLYGIPVDQIMPLIYGGLIPFNLVKGVITSLTTVLFFGRVRRILMS